MDSILEHAYVIPLIPAASFLIILFFGKRLPFKGAEVGIAALAICFVLALGANVQWRHHVNESEHKAEVATATSAGEGHSGTDEEFSVAPYTHSWTWFE